MKKVLAAAILCVSLAACTSTIDAASTGSFTRYASVTEAPVAATPQADAEAAEVEVTGSVAAPAQRAPRCEYDPYYERRVCYR